jgi:hypothetical protein
MLRILLIATTIFATALGSLGLPVYLHSCRMQAMETEAAGCPMCDARKDARPVVPAGHESTGACCNDSVVHQRTDDGTMARAEIPMPLFAGIVTLVALEMSTPIAPSLSASQYGPSPPGLAARTQHSYLLNSTFLI